MEFKKLQKQIEQNIDKVNTTLKLNTPEENSILAHTVKLNEEVGELCNDILAILKLQRKAKLKRFERKNMHEEFADVLIALMQLAALAQVDIEDAVVEKLKKIEKRFQEEKNL